MIFTGFTLACLTGTAFWLLYKKLPARIKRFMQKHVLVTDAIACFLTYSLFGGTLTALFASAWLGIIVTVLLSLTKNPATNALLEEFSEKVGRMKDKFLVWANNRLEEQARLRGETVPSPQGQE